MVRLQQADIPSGKEVGVCKQKGSREFVDPAARGGCLLAREAVSLRFTDLQAIAAAGGDEVGGSGAGFKVALIRFAAVYRVARLDRRGLGGA